MRLDIIRPLLHYAFALPLLLHLFFNDKLDSRTLYPPIILTRILKNSISGPMTGALVIYSATFARYALAVTPKNYLLFGCHAINFSAQSVQAYRYLNYWKYVLFRYTHTLSFNVVWVYIYLVYWLVSHGRG